MDLLSLILQQQLSELHMCLIGSLIATRHAVLCVRRTSPEAADILQMIVALLTTTYVVFHYIES